MEKFKLKSRLKLTEKAEKRIRIILKNNEMTEKQVGRMIEDILTHLLSLRVKVISKEGVVTPGGAFANVLKLHKQENVISHAMP